MMIHRIFVYLSIVLFISFSSAIKADDFSSNITIELFDSNGDPIVEGQTVTGVITGKATVINSNMQHAQFYKNFRVMHTNEAGHMINSANWVRTFTINTTEFLDGENLISMHVHPMNVSGETYLTDFDVSAFKIVTSNNNPAPNGDVLLPTMTLDPTKFIVSESSLTAGHILETAFGAAIINDDFGTIDIDHQSSPTQEAQVIPHLGASVLGRFRWSDFSNPFGDSDGKFITGVHLLNFQKDIETSGRIVFFFNDGCGRANYAFQSITIPAISSEERSTYELPNLDAQILNVQQGDVLVIPYLSTPYNLKVKVYVKNPTVLAHEFVNMTTWIGNRSINVTDIREHLNSLEPGQSSFEILVPIPEWQVRAMRDVRQGGQDSAAFAMWIDFDKADNFSIPTSGHLHLNTVISELNTWNFGAPIVNIQSPKPTEDQFGGITIQYAVMGELSEAAKLYVQLDAGTPELITDYTGVQDVLEHTFSNLPIGSHNARFYLADAEGVELVGVSTSSDLNFYISNASPVAVADKYVVVENQELFVDAASGLLSNDTDLEEGSLIVSSISKMPSKGLLSWNADGSFTYTPNTNVYGMDYFKYIISDGTNTSQEGIVTFGIKATNMVNEISGNWLPKGNGLENTGYQPGFVGDNAPILLWSRSIPYSSDPVIVDGLIYINSHSGHPTYTNDGFYLKSIDERTGYETWEINSSSDSFWGPGYDNGVLYSIHNSSNQIVALNAIDGSLIWESTVQPNFEPLDTDIDPFVASGRLWAINGDFIFGFNLSTGVREVQYDVSQIGQWEPAFTNGKLYAWDQQSLYEIDLTTGLVSNSIDIPRPLGSGTSTGKICIEGENAYLMGPRDLYSLNLSTFTQNWKVNVKASNVISSVSGTSVADGVVYVIDGTRVKSFDAKTGTPLGNYETQYTLLTAQKPIITADKIIVCNYNRTFIFNKFSFELDHEIAAGGFLSLSNNQLTISGYTKNPNFYNSTFKSYLIAYRDRTNDQSPFVENPISDVEIEDNTAAIVNLSDIFADNDDSDSSFYYTIFSNSDSNVATATIVDGQLVIQKVALGSTDITVRVNSFGLTVDYVVSVNVINENPPTISGSPVEKINLGQNYSFTPTASDLDGDALSFNITNKPSWASFDVTTGTLSGTPVENDPILSNGIIISVTDGFRTVELPEFRIVVDHFYNQYSENITIELFDANGTPIAEGQTVSGIITGKSTVINSAMQHAQFYENFRVLHTNEHGHMIDSNNWVRTFTVDTTKFYDGENLISMHVHPMNVPGETHLTDFDVAAFKIVTSNANPAPNGDTNLPLIDVDDNHSITVPSFTTVPGMSLHAPTVGIYDDEGWIDVDQNLNSSNKAQLISHLGASVLGRFRWVTRDPPFGEDRSIFKDVHLNPFQKDIDVPSRVVFFCSDEVGRANYGFMNFTVPAMPAVDRAASPLPALDAKILNLSQGDSVVISSEVENSQYIGYFNLKVEVQNPQTLGEDFHFMTTWVGNRAVAVTDLRPYIREMESGETSFVVDVRIPYIEIKRLQDSREGGQDSTAFAVWIDFTDGFSNLPTSNHLHLTSIRSDDVTWNYGSPTVSIQSPYKTEELIGGANVEFAVSGNLSAANKLYIQVDSDSPVEITDYVGTQLLSNYNISSLTRGAHTITMYLADNSSTPLADMTATDSVSIIINNQAPSLQYDHYVVLDGESSINADANNGVLSNDTDLEGDSLTAILDQTTSNGVLSLNSDGSFTYTPNIGFYGVDYFRYIANDGTENSQSISVNISVYPPSENLGAFGNWETFGNGNAHTGFQGGFVGSNSPTQLWVKDLQMTASGSTSVKAVNQVVVADGRVYVNAKSFYVDLPNSRNVYALDVADGNILWTYTDAYGGQGHSPLTYFNGDIFLKTRTGQQHVLSSIDASTGSRNWFSSIGGSSSVHYYGPICFGSTIWSAGPWYSSGGMYAHDLNTGNMLFFKDFDYRDEWTPSLYNGKLYVWQEGVLRELNANNGNTLRTVDTHRTSRFQDSSLACLDDGMAYVVNNPSSVREPGSFQIIDLNTFKIIHKQNDTDYHGTPAVNSGQVFLLHGNKVNVLSSKSGTQLGSCSAPQVLKSIQPIISDDRIIVSSTNETYFFDRFTFQLVSTIPHAGHLSLANNNLYIAANDGLLYCYQVSFPTPPNTAPVISGTPIPEGTTVVANEAFSFVPTVTDTAGDTLTFSIVNKPGWATFNTSDGTLSGTPSSVGIYSNIIITVEDQGGLTDSLEPFQIEVLESNTYTVTFVTDERGTSSGELVQTVASGSAATDPGIIPVSGWDFIGWDAAFDNVTANLSVTALYASNNPKLSMVKISGVDENWKTVILPYEYYNPIIVTTPVYDNSGPVVTRIRNRTGSSFEICIQRADNETAAASAVDVTYAVAEAGAYNEADHGVTLEAGLHSSTVTDNAGSWQGENVSLINQYTNPVVYGQVMSYNDARWSVFWSSNGNRKNPASAGSVYVGKHVGEDGDQARSNETLGYIAAESGTYTLGSQQMTFSLGSDTITGYDDSINSYADDGSISVATMAAMDGVNGGWAVLYGNSGSVAGSLKIVIDEDAKVDAERAHTNEQVSLMSMKNSSTADSPKLHTGLVKDITEKWVTVSLPDSYSSMVVVATPVYKGTTVPAVTRIRNAGGSSFELRLQSADGQESSLSNIDVTFTVVEEGVYNLTEHGINMEAVKYTSSMTDGKGSFNGELRSYGQAYTSPVVLGQVMSYNDTKWSVFWSCGSSSGNIADASNLYTGKHVGEDTNKDRLKETVGYIVIDSGSYTLDGKNYTAGVGQDSVNGIDNGQDTYSLDCSMIVLTQAAMDGGDGGWAVLNGSEKSSGGTVSINIDEDTINDSERKHTSEQVGYLLVE